MAPETKTTDARLEDVTRKHRTYGEAKRKRTRPPHPSKTSNNNLKIGRYENDIERHRKGFAESIKDMAKRNSKTAAQQCRFYEVDNIFEYMVETYINGNFSTFREMYKELCKDARKDFIDFLLSEVEPVYWREILKETI